MRVLNIARIPVQSVTKSQALSITELIAQRHTGTAAQSTKITNHLNLKLFQRDIVVLVQQQGLNQNVIDQPVSVMTVQQKDIPERNTRIKSQVNTMRFHQSLVLSHVKVQKHPEPIGKDHTLQPTMAILQNSGREITACIMLRTDHRSPQIMVTLGEDFDHHHLIIRGDILDARH